MIAPAPFPASDTLWLSIGLLGQMLFSARFLIQWIASERQRRSVVPRAFWYFSLAGGIVLLAYAIRRADPVFIIGQAAGILIYGRNLYFVAGRPRPAQTAGVPRDVEL
ncbi:lipid-A-disaccharide synthase N-terminal domain-containing protein [Hyphomicrobium sp.]|uniref:lipid-A-disaccharide synthase N-terminal domain-containing protein n=1 Tax=Hyphomicrobium sp. TaxID=82 RepID=UPI002FDD79D0